MVSNSRRKFMTLAGGAIGAAGLGLWPDVLRRAWAVESNRKTGTIRDVEHIVIMMQENRSFDHYFGSLRGVRGFADPHPLRLADDKTVWQQPYDGGHVLPFRPNLPDLGMQYLDGTPHNWVDSQKAWNGGRCDQWVPAKGVHTMMHFNREDIPFYYALADAFTVCDAYHCSVMGPTDPNRYHMWSGCLGNDGTGGGPVIDNAEKGYGWMTFPQRLQAAGINWKIYQDVGNGLDAAGRWGDTEKTPFVGNYGDNSLLYFNAYREALPGSALHERARTGTNLAKQPQQSLLAQLKADVLGKRLPQVTWIVAPEAYSEHSNWPVNLGAAYVAQVLEALSADEDSWSKTALFVTYDENDGFFDHVPAPFPAGSRAQGLSTLDTHSEWFAGDAKNPPGPYGLGARVPMTVVSPWSKGGWVCSQVFDHTSLIRFVEERFGPDFPGIRETQITPWRRAVCGDLTSAFDFGQRDTKAVRLPATSSYVAKDAERHPKVQPLPETPGSMPRQERGQRPARPLPYALEVQGLWSESHQTYSLTFHNTGSAAAVFLVHDLAGQTDPRSYTVETGKVLMDEWALSTRTDVGHDLEVRGPNGFFRHFRASHPALSQRQSGSMEVRTAAQALDGGKLKLTLHNRSRRVLTAVVRAADYMNQPQRQVSVAPGAQLTSVHALSATKGWYDLSVRLLDDEHFLCCFAGHVETGSATWSDPALET